ncbi:MAG: DUF115 domain-containing protein [Hyphomonas sp.]|jgi:hypothetical protein|nr:DUF115 domain-containing protein [Hyphomonas sp.]
MNLLDPAYLRRRMAIEVERVRRYSAYWGLYRTEDDKGFLQLRDTRKGEPCFVIGNGPSLTIADLDRIHAQGWCSIASNKIYLSFDATPWRPDILTVADKLVAEEVAPRFKELDLLKVVPRVYRRLFDGAPGAGRTLHFCAIPVRKRTIELYQPKFSDNPLKGLFVGQTVTVLNIQLAAWLGCDPIILLGLDGKYAVASNRDVDTEYGTVAVTGNEHNHFHKDYRKPGDRWSIPRPDMHEKEYARCVRTLHDMGRTIVNASRTSYVEAFARADLDTLFAEFSRPGHSQRTRLGPQRDIGRSGASTA